MLTAMLLNLLFAALARSGRDAVFGSSVMLTAITDIMGFFVFLGLASLILV